MPRKQNGFGNPKSLGFKGAGRVDRGKGVGAPGSTPATVAMAQASLVLLLKNIT